MTDHRFENYPPAPTIPGPDDLVADPFGGTVAPAKPYSIPPQTGGTSRRTMLAGTIGVAVAIGLGIYVVGDEDDRDPAVRADLILVAGHEISVPLNWKYEVSAEGDTATLTRAGNVVKIVAVGLFDGEQAIDVIRGRTSEVVPVTYTGRTFQEPVDSSSGDYDRATLTGAAELHGAHVRILANLWLDDGDGLIAVRLLTEASDSSYTTEAADIVRALGEDF